MIDIGIIINLGIWVIVILQWIIIYKINKDTQIIEIDISEPRLGIKL